MHSIPCAFLTLRLLGADARSGFVGCSKAVVCESALRLYLGRSRIAWPFGAWPIPVPCSRLSTSEQFCGFHERTLRGGARSGIHCRACASDGRRLGSSILSHLFADGLAGMHYKVNVSIGRVPFLFCAPGRSGCRIGASTRTPPSVEQSGNARFPALGGRALVATSRQSNPEAELHLKKRSVVKDQASL